MRISDWSSDVCSSDLSVQRQKIGCKVETQRGLLIASIADRLFVTANRASNAGRAMLCTEIDKRSEEHTSELQSLMRISYAVFCLKKKKKQVKQTRNHTKTTTNKIKHSTVTDEQLKKI